MKLKSPHQQTARVRNMAVVVAFSGFAMTLGGTAVARAPSTTPSQQNNRPHDLASRRTSLVNGDLLSAAGNRIASVVDDLRRGATYFAPADVDTFPPPGIMVGITAYDIQHNYSQGHQIAANPGANTVHFAWMMEDWIACGPEECSRFVNYNSYSISAGTTNQGFNGTTVSQGEWSRSGMPRIDVDGDNLAHLVMHQRIELGAPYTNWHLLFPLEGSAFHVDSNLTPNPRHADDLWPDVAIEQRSGFTLPPWPTSGPGIRHVIGSGAIDWGGGVAFPSGLISYWRFDEAAPAQAWEGPVIIDSSYDISYVIDAADDRGKVAVAFTSDWFTDGFDELNNVAYHESQTSGIGWIDGTELGPAFRYLITSYDDPDGPQAWPYVSVAYDHQGTLHIVWTEQRIANVSEHTAICHWNSLRQAVRPVAAAYYDNPNVWEKSLNLSQVTLGIGDGSTLCKYGTEANLDYLYVLYTKLGGETPEEQADRSKAGFSNGELYLTASADGGHSWSPPANLTNTKSPGCTSTHADSVCASEAWATIARDVDAINIFYIADFEAGSFLESPWTMNRTLYLRHPGGTTDAEYVCPIFGPNLVAALSADPKCEYHAAPGMTNEELLTLGNIGNIALTGEVTIEPTDSWLTVIGAGPFEIEATEPDLEYPVIMDAAGLSEGLYGGLIRITHNDTSKPSPVDYPIDFFVVDDFHCPEATILRTAVFGDQGVLSLQVGTDGRFGAPDPAGGLLRPLDLSSAIFDATLLVAHGAQDPDTVVYHRFYNSDDPGQHGFRSVAALYVDTFSYSSGDGLARASAQMTTKDSAIGITAAWYYPQGAAYGDFVLLKYTLSNLTPEPITDVAVGVYADFNVLAGLNERAVQEGVGNHGNYIQAQNLIYMYGYDTIGHTPSDHLNSSQRYSAGITYLAGRDAYGESFSLEQATVSGAVDDNRINNRTTGLYSGPTSGHLYESLVCTPGVSIWEPSAHADSAKDTYLWLTLDQGRTLDPNGINPEVYVVALVSDTLQHPAYSIAPKLAGGLTDVVDSAWSWAEFRYPCVCGHHGDPQPDGLTDVLDVVKCVDVAFRGAPPIFDDCQWERTDVDCTGYTDVIDVVHFVNVAFRGGDPQVEFPCVCY